MGYHVSILRTIGDERVAIGRDEITSVVSQRNDVVYRENAAGHLEIAMIGDESARPLLVLQDGEIWTKNPDRKTLQLMIDLATALKARVRGDELETYRTPDETYSHPDDRKTVDDSAAQTERLLRVTRRKQWTLNVLIIGFFTALVMLAKYCS